MAKQLVKLLALGALATLSFAGDDTAPCDSVLIAGEIAERIDRDLGMEWPFFIDNPDAVRDSEYCSRSAIVSLRNVRVVEPYGCGVPSDLLIRVEGQFGWRMEVIQDHAGISCRAVGPFFTSHWHEGATVYVLVWRPGAGGAFRCSEIRCDGGSAIEGRRSPREEQHAGTKGEGNADGQSAAADEKVPEVLQHCDSRLDRLVRSLPQMCARQEDFIVVVPRGHYLKRKGIWGPIKYEE